MNHPLSIADAAALLQRGELVAFPTETVYGLGASALDANAVAKIYALKGRPATSPLIVHVASIDMAKTLAAEWPSAADALARAFWPGPLTLVVPKNVLPKKTFVPNIVTAGLATVGIRVPNHPVALQLIDAAGLPLAAPSANRFMQLSPTTAAHVRAAFGDELPVLDGGACRVGIESTVVQILDGQVTLLRPGGISRKQIEAALGQVVRSIDEVAAGASHPAPGMHARHYSPRTPLVLVHSPADLPAGLGAYIWHSQFSLLPGAHMPGDPSEYAARLYDVLHELDNEGWAWIAVELPPESPEWEAVRDRLKRAGSL